MIANPRCKTCSRPLYYDEFYCVEFDGWYCHYCDLAGPGDVIDGE